MIEMIFAEAEADLLDSAVTDYAAILRRNFPKNDYAKSCADMLEDIRDQLRKKLYGEDKQ